MSDTSRAAANSIIEVASQMRARVLVEIQNRGGATCDELEDALNLSHQTTSPRVHELMETGQIVDSGARRPTRSGAKAIVWAIAAPKPVQLVLPMQPRVTHSIEEVEALGGYPLIYADPAWSYEQKGRGSTDNHYTTMSLADICALSVARIAAKDAVLFIWGTWPNLPMVMATIPAWGFQFKTCGWVWVKHHEPSMKECVGGGFWSRANTEFCLIGVRGDHPKRVDKTIRQLVHTGPEEILCAPRQEHSTKPPEVRERIMKLMGDLPRIELFSRDRVSGWDAWGDQVPGGSDVALVSQKGGA